MSLNIEKSGKQDLTHLPNPSINQIVIMILQVLINLLPDDKILDWSKLEQTADNILKCI